MGITTDKFFENIYSAVFSPKAFFEREDENISVRVAAGTVVLVSLIYQFASGIFNASILKVTFIFTLTMNVLCSLIMWFFTARTCDAVYEKQPFWVHQSTPSFRLEERKMRVCLV